MFSLALSKISSQLCNVTFRSFVWFFVQEILVIEFSSNFTIIYLYIITPKSVCHQAHYFHPWLEIFFFNWLKQNISNIQIVWKKKMKKYKEAEKLWALNHFPISRPGRGWGPVMGHNRYHNFWTMLFLAVKICTLLHCNWCCLKQKQTWKSDKNHQSYVWNHTVLASIITVVK